MRFYLLILIISLTACTWMMDDTINGDIEVQYPQNELSAYGLALEKLVLSPSGKESVSWTPGEEALLPVALEYGWNTLSVSHFIRFQGKQIFEYSATMRIFKSPETNQKFIVIAGEPVIAQMQVFRLTIKPQLNPSYCLKGIDFLARGKNMEYAFRWEPDSPGELEVFLYNPPEEALQLEVTRYVSSAPEGIVEDTEIYPIASGQKEMVIDGGKFENLFLLNRDTKTIALYSPGTFFSSFSTQKPRYTLSLPKDTVSVNETLLSSRGNVLVRRNGDQGLIYRRLLNGSYSSGEVIKEWPAGYSPVFAGDLNGDGREDLFFLANIQTGSSSSLSYLFASGLEEGGFDFSGDPQSCFSIPGTASIKGSLERLDGDPFFDILFYHSVAESADAPPLAAVYALYGPFNGEPVLLATIEKDVISIDSGDFDNDGHRDILLGTGISNPDPGEIVLLKNSGEGFSVRDNIVDMAIEYETRGIFSATADFGDLNGDGRLDIFSHVYHRGTGIEDVWGKISLQTASGTYVATQYMEGIMIYRDPAYLYVHRHALSPLF